MKKLWKAQEAYYLLKQQVEDEVLHVPMKLKKVFEYGFNAVFTGDGDYFIGYDQKSFRDEKTGALSEPDSERRKAFEGLYLDTVVMVSRIEQDDEGYDFAVISKVMNV